MTELDKLCESLDEAGVQYLKGNASVVVGYYGEDPQPVSESLDGTLIVGGLTADDALRALVRP